MFLFQGFCVQHYSFKPFPSHFIFYFVFNYCLLIDFHTADLPTFAFLFLSSFVSPCCDVRILLISGSLCFNNWIINCVLSLIKICSLSLKFPMGRIHWTNWFFWLTSSSVKQGRSTKLLSDCSTKVKPRGKNPSPCPLPKALVAWCRGLRWEMGQMIGLRAVFHSYNQDFIYVHTEFILMSPVKNTRSGNDCHFVYMWGRRYLGRIKYVKFVPLI